MNRIIAYIVAAVALLQLAHTKPDGTPDGNVAGAKIVTGSSIPGVAETFGNIEATAGKNGIQTVASGCAEALGNPILGGTTIVHILDPAAPLG